MQLNKDTGPLTIYNLIQDNKLQRKFWPIG